MTDGILKHAIFSECGKYRYVLSRIWNRNAPLVQCIGLNPSTANAEDDDPTIKSLTRILTNAGFGGFHMTNLFALISPYPEDLRSCPDPLKLNDTYLFPLMLTVDTVIVCWGNFKQAEYRKKTVLKKINHAQCFGQNANGSPKHPLYLKSDTKIVTYKF
jgi:hypothetical protein